MQDAHNIIEEISNFLDKSMLKKSTVTKAELINFIEQKWSQADDRKFAIHQGMIITARMINEYIRAGDFSNMMRWLDESDRHSSSQINESYIQNYYKGQCCLECGNKDMALIYFNLCYAENPDYIYSRAPFCYEFFNKHLENPRALPKSAEEDVVVKNKVLKLPYWQSFFGEEKEEFGYEILLDDFETVQEPGENHSRGLNYLQDNQEDILKKILTALLQKYPDLQKDFDYPEEDKADYMPDLTAIEGFANLLTPTKFFVTSIFQNEYPYIGFGFSCSWDSEHALGIMTCKDRVIDIGDAEMSFAIWLAKKDVGSMGM